jgi:hypothetical protein
LHLYRVTLHPSRSLPTTHPSFVAHSSEEDHPREAAARPRGGHPAGWLPLRLPRPPPPQDALIHHQASQRTLAQPSVSPLATHGPAFLNRVQVNPVERDFAPIVG